jgi:signal transduction histidine kinase
MDATRNDGRAGPARWLRGLAAACAALALAACSGAGEVAELSGAGFLRSDAAAPPGDAAPWAGQRLPDDWLATRPGETGFGWYRFEVALAAPGGHDYGFYLTAALSNAQLFANGTFVGQSGDLLGEPPRRWEAEQLFTVPRATLRPGTNVFHLRVHVPADSRGGLGKVLVGPREALYLRALRDEFGHAIGPAVASLTIAVLGVFMLVLWLRARNDPDYLLFAAASILWGLHTGASLLPREPLPRPHFWVWWNAVYVLFVVLLCVFVVRFTGTRWPRYERGALLYAAASVPVLYAAPAPAFALWAAGVRLGALALALAALAAVVRAALRRRETTAWLLLATTAVAAAFGIHDWLAVRDPDDLRPVYLVPYVALLFIAFVGWMMIDRFVGTLRQYEALTRELESRVAEKSRALEVEAARQADLRREAESANLSKSRFLAAASHDLRQPLHALGLFASALDERVREPGSRELAGRIGQSIASLESLFDQVLDVSRLDAGAVTAEPGPVPLQPLFDRIANDLSSNAEEKGLALRFVPTGRCVRTDPHLLERVVRNLVSNAIRYTDRGGILVGVRPRGARLALEVRDPGVGIPADEHPRVFEEFYQAGGRDRSRREGLGLGLSIVKRLCDLLGHGLELASAPGRGTTFRILLEPAQAPLAAPSPAAPAPQAPLAGTFVVVVDDERDVRDSMVALLAAWDCRVAACPSTQEALAAVPAGSPPPALIVADYRLAGGETGLDAVKAMREAWGVAVPAVIISGESSAAELARIRESGLPLLHKPVPPAKLRSLLLHLRAQRP